MATTVASDLIVPDVWADAIMTTVQGKTVLTPLTAQDDQLAGQPGDSVIFPKYGYIGDAVDLTENVAMDTTKLTMTDSRATIKEAGKAVELTDTALLTALGNPNDQARQQLGLSIARKLDADIRAAAELVTTGEGASSPLIAPAVDGPLTWAAIVGGLALLGDEYDPAEIAGIVIHSTQQAELFVDPLFINSQSFGAGAVLQRGLIGQIGTMPVFVSDRATAGAGARRNALIIKRGAIALKYKRRPIVETDRDILKRTTVITTNVHYAAKRVDDRGVIVLPTGLTA